MTQEAIMQTQCCTLIVRCCVQLQLAAILHLSSQFLMKAPQCSQVSISLFVQCELVLVGCCKVSLNLADDMMSHGSFSAATWSPTYIARPLEFYVAYIVSKVISYCACRHTSICLVVSVDLPWPYRTFRSLGCTVISDHPVRKF